MKRITLLLIGILITSFAIAQTQEINKKLAPNTKCFMARMNQSDLSPTQRKAILKTKSITQIGSQNYINCFIILSENANAQVLEEKGVVVNARAKDIITAKVPIDMIETIASLPEVKYIQMGTPVHKKMDKARIASKVDKVQAGESPLAHSYLGKDVVIGIIDNGFEYGHPNFYNKDHTEYRVKRVWNQNASQTLHPAGFSYGKEYTTKEEILAAQSDSLYESHGTHVTGIATGADRTSKYYGIAGDADIVLVSFLSDNTDVLNGIKYIYDYAASVGKPCVINISLGVYAGPHDGTSTFDLAADELQGKGKLLVGAAGNEGNSNAHISKTFSANDTINSTFFKFKKSGNIVCDLWGEVGKKYKVQTCIYDSTAMKVAYLSPIYNADDTAYFKKYSLTTNTNKLVRGYIYFSYNIDPNNNKPNLYIYSALTTNFPSGYYLGFIVKAVEGTVNAWTDASNDCSFTSKNQSGWSDGDNNYSLSETGGTGKKIISVGAYVTSSTFTNLNNETYTTNEIVNELAPFSSLGPTVDGRMKPDIAAPGSIIISSISNYGDTSIGVKKTTVDGQTYYYGYMEGTSMATPQVTGILATWLQANPQLTPADVRSIFQKTAIIDSYTGSISTTGSNKWGYGKINAFDGLVEVIKQSTGIENISSLPSVLMYATLNNNQLLNFLFTQGDTNVQINVFNVNGQKLLSKNFSEINSRQEEILDLGGLSKGLYIIKVTGNKCNQVFKACTE